VTVGLGQRDAFQHTLRPRRLVGGLGEARAHGIAQRLGRLHIQPPRVDAGAAVAASAFAHAGRQILLCRGPVVAPEGVLTARGLVLLPEVLRHACSAFTA
jgi:hypothetical protein